MCIAEKSYKMMTIFIMGIIFLAGCDGNSSKLKSSTPDRFHSFDISDEVPDYIDSLDNVSIFSGDFDALYSIKLSEEWKVGETGEPFLPRISAAVVDDQGRVIVRSTNLNYQTELFILNSDGTLHSKLGRYGRGPGEYGIVTAIYSKANKIYANDFTNKRLNEYSSVDYSYQRTIIFEDWKVPDGYELNNVQPRQDGNYLLTFSELKTKTGALESVRDVQNENGNGVEFKLLRFPDGYRVASNDSKSKPMTPTLPLRFLARTVSSLSSKDELFTNEAPEFLIKKYDNTGNYKSSIYYPILGEKFDLEDYLESSRFSPSKGDIKKALSSDGIDIPDRRSAISDIFVDDENRIWVALSIGINREIDEWWILNEKGELLAKLEQPRNEPIYDVKNGYLYSKKKNLETGAEYLVKYKIEFTKH